MMAYAKKPVGLTLIEVLISLAIVGIAMTAIIKAVSQNIRTTRHLQEKTIATFVAQYVLNEVKLGLLQLPDNDALDSKSEVLGNLWYWQAKEAGTPNKRIKKIIVNVNDREITDATKPLMSLEGYTYHEK